MDLLQQPGALPTSPRTLVFCTAYVGPDTSRTHTWDLRYRVWIDAIKSSRLRYDQILLIDDGSTSLPNWHDISIMLDNLDAKSENGIALYHFPEHLGRRSVSDFPGWVRSFLFAARYAVANGFDKVIHIESDAFLISERIQCHFNDLMDGWIALWCPRWSRPESGIQVIAGEALGKYAELAQRDYEEFAGLVIETALPFTKIERTYRGDRYGEYIDYVPRDADWCMQTVPPSGVAREDFYWWLPAIVHGASIAMTIEAGEPGKEMTHSGVDYLGFMLNLDRVLGPRSYFEIGTNEGRSLRCYSCDAVCVDPRFVLEANVIRARKRTFFFQSTSDEFFADNSLAAIFPGGVDIAFLDGFHHFEVLLRDFLNTEKSCHPRSLVLLHDCLPFNETMVDRVPVPGFWTGDVWKILPALKKYRPDLRIIYLDCPPTGLVACTNLTPASSILSASYDTIVAEFSDLTLTSFGVERLWSLFPMIQTKTLTGNTAATKAFFGLYPT